jgi:hypothetical protein
MKFTSQIILLLFAILIFLGIFLHYLNLLESKQTKEEEANKIREATTEEGFDTADNKNCPNLLIHRGDMIVLYNTQAKQPHGSGGGAGTHVVAVFKTMAEYAQYVKEQQQRGNYCPVLYLRQESNAQGNDIYRMYSPPYSGNGNPNFPLPPNGLDGARTNSVWDLHHQPPFYVEGGLPPIPTEPVDNSVIKVVDASRESGQFNQDQYPGFDPYGLYVGKLTNLDEIHESTQNKGKHCSLNPADSNWCGIVDTQKAVDSGVYAMNEVTRPIYPKATFV